MERLSDARPAAGTPGGRRRCLEGKFGNKTISVNVYKHQDVGLPSLAITNVYEEESIRDALGTKATRVSSRVPIVSSRHFNPDDSSHEEDTFSGSVIKDFFQAIYQSRSIICYFFWSQ